MTDKAKAERVPAKQAARFRARRHLLASRAPAGALGDAAALACGVPAASASDAQVALWARVEGVRRSDVERTVAEERTLVKTWAMRGEMHLLRASDLGVYLAAVRAPTERIIEADLTARGIDWDEVERITDAVGDVLAGQWLDRRGLASAVGSVLGPRAREMLAFGWADLLRVAAVRGLVCFGPQRGKDVTFIRPDEWVENFAMPEERAARAELVRRYLASYGPASPEDLAAWSGLDATEAAEAFDSVRRDIVAVTADRSGYVLKRDMRHLMDPDEGVRLLEASDPFLNGHADATHLVEAKDRRRARGKPPVVAAGRVIGRWDVERHGGRSTVKVTLYGTATKSKRDEIAGEADGLGRFLGAAATDVVFAT